MASFPPARPTPRRRVGVLVAVVLLATTAVPAWADSPSAEDLVDTTVETDADTDERWFDGAPTFTELLADELGVEVDDLRGAAARARQRLLDDRIERLGREGVTDPADLLERLRQTDRPSAEDLHHAARDLSDRIADHVERRATDESAEAVASWLQRTAERIQPFFERLGDAIGDWLSSSLDSN